MKTFIATLLLILSFGCAHNKAVMPTMDLPTAPARPAIQTVTVKQGDSFLVGYTVPDALKLYEYLLAQDAYADKLEDRIKMMNKLWSNQ